MSGTHAGWIIRVRASTEPCARPRPPWRAGRDRATDLVFVADGTGDPGRVEESNTPGYQASACAYRRWLVAAHAPGVPIRASVIRQPSLGAGGVEGVCHVPPHANRWARR